MRYGISMYGAVMAHDNLARIDDSSLRKFGYTLFRVWATWERDYAGNTVSGYRVVNSNGSIDATNLQRLKNVIARIAAWGGVVDVTIGAKAGQLGMANITAHKTGVTNLVTALRGIKGIWCIDVANEFIAAGYTDAQVADLLKTARAADSSRGGFTASADGPASTIVTRYKGVIAALGSGWKNYLGMYAPHFGPRTSSLAGATESNVKAVKSGLSSYPLNLYAQEEGRWNNPFKTEAEFYTSAAGAKRGGAVAYVLHNAAGYDLRSKTFLSQLVKPPEYNAVNLLPGKTGP